jgi:hypothetical protein
MNSNSQSMTPPLGGSKKEKNPNLKLISAGYHPAYLYGIVGTGSHETKFGIKPEVMLFFEFPFEKQIIYQEDKDPKVMVLSENMNYLISFNSEKQQYSKLALRLKTGFNIDITKPKEVDLSKIIGMPCIVNVIHNLGKDGKTYANIESLGVLSPMFITGREDKFVRTNDLILFDINFGFESENFAGIYPWVQNKIKESVEGKLHASKGGQFAKYINNKMQDKDQSSSESIKTNTDAIQSFEQKVQQNNPTKSDFEQVPNNEIVSNLAPDDLPF